MGPELIGYCYTRSRRYPLVIGRMPGRGGGYLPGGPYTLTQAVVFLLGLLLVWKIPGFGWFGLGRWLLPVGAALGIRRARIAGRSPLGWLLGLLTHLLTPATGLCRGRRYHPPTPRASHGRIWIHRAPAPRSPLAGLLDTGRG